MVRQIIVIGIGLILLGACAGITGPDTAVKPVVEGTPERPAAVAESQVITDTTPITDSEPMTGAEVITSDIELSNAWVRAPGMPPQDSAGRGPGPKAKAAMPVLDANDSPVFVNLFNASDTDDTLLNVSSAGTSTATMYQTTPVHEIESVSQIELPAGSTVFVNQGPGYHIVLEDITQDLRVGDRVELTFTFQHAGEIQVEVPVRMPTPPGQ